MLPRGGGCFPVVLAAIFFGIPGALVLGLGNFPLNLISVRFFAEGGSDTYIPPLFIGSFGILQDITAVKETESALKEALEEKDYLIKEINLQEKLFFRKARNLRRCLKGFPLPRSPAAPREKRKILKMSSRKTYRSCTIRGRPKSRSGLPGRVLTWKPRASGCFPSSSCPNRMI